MKNTTLFLPGFHLATLRRKPRSVAQRLAEEKARIRQHSISQLSDCFSHLIPAKALENEAEGVFSRRRLFSKENTFWAFFSQILDADGGCQEVVRKVQALAVTQANQQVWPQPASQKPGCGFPQARLCACFCLQTGALLSYRLGSNKNAELPLLRQQWSSFSSGDIFLGDKGFCSYYDVWQFKQRGVDSVITLARRTPVASASAVAVLGPEDLLIRWPKPVWSPRLSYSKEAWQALPDYLDLRQIKVTIDVPGIRSASYYLITTLTDAACYSATELADLYRQRWDVELFFRDIKTTLGMDVLRCRTPDLVKKEILMYFIAYNVVRRLIVDAANTVACAPRRISFKASIQALRQWESQLHRCADNISERWRLLGSLRAIIGDRQIIPRPGRREPRCLKRRPKPFALLTASRDQMIETPHRGRYRANGA